MQKKTKPSKQCAPAAISKMEKALIGFVFFSTIIRRFLLSFPLAGHICFHHPLRSGFVDSLFISFFFFPSALFCEPVQKAATKTMSLLTTVMPRTGSASARHSTQADCASSAPVSTDPAATERHVSQSHSWRPFVYAPLDDRGCSATKVGDKHGIGCLRTLQSG